MDSTPSAYEVRCARCEVSFPVETRRCLHCGGPTGRPGTGVALESWVSSNGEVDDEFPEPTGLLLPGQDGREIETPDEPSSIGRSLIRSLGGFVWIIVLIGFTLARNCGGE